MKRSVPALLLLGVFALQPRAATAQDPPPPPPPGPPTETELVFEREVFTYPSFTRGNPFLPLLASNSGGPRYEQLRLAGIIHSDTPGRSIATLSTSVVSISETGAVSAEEGGESYHLKVGQVVGNVTIVAINAESVEVDVEEFGVTDRKTMRLLNLLGGNQ